MCLYSGCSGESLNSLRYTRFCQKVATCNACVQQECLSPDISCCQLPQYVGISSGATMERHESSAQEWGWELRSGKLLPLRTNLPPAHSSLLETIRCSCKTDCRTERFTCWKNGLDCSPAFGACRGVSCTNAVLLDFADEDGDDTV